LPVADGSDMMGSLRNPAAYNNVIGFRPSLGLIPNASTEEIFISQLATNGPMGRTVADTARLLATQAGFDYQSPLSSQINPNIFNETLNPPKPLKIGWLSNLTQELPIEAEILNLCEEALKIFATCGHTIEAVDFPINTETIWSCWKTLRHWQVAGN